jgi:two-component system chemotaxis sensor kinase CheA
VTTSEFIPNEDMQDILREFLVETDELVSALGANLVKLEQAPDDRELLNEIFRTAHTIKGTSGFLGLSEVSILTHRMEDMLNRLRKGEKCVTADIMDALLKALDALTSLVENVRNHEPPGTDISEILDCLKALTEDQDAPDHSTGVSPGEVSVSPQEKPSPGAASDRGHLADGPMSKVRRTTTDSTIRVDVERLDTLMDLTGELVLSRNTLVQSFSNLSDTTTADSFEQAGRSVATVNGITSDLQDAVMSMRMLPVAKVFARFPRLVRDLARETGKRIALVTSGGDTEVDKSLIDLMADPLVHVIRNACDHGIEPPSDRVAAGKPEEGRVHLSAVREGSFIVLRVSDDGRGMDVAAIRSRAVERRLVTQSEADRMNPRDILNFVFQPGFTTTSEVTDLSGRGVGMDVLRDAVEKLGGSTDLSSTPGDGTTVQIKLPLTLAIVQGLLIEVDQNVYVLPMSSVQETVKTSQSDMSYLNRRPVLRLRNEVIPVVSLSAVLNRLEEYAGSDTKTYIVVVGLDDRKIGIPIDRFLGQEEVVIKSLGGYLMVPDGLAGATILGDGRVRLIIDVPGLFVLSRQYVN